MTNITLSIPENMKRKMDLLEEINWSAVARAAFDEKIRDMDFIKKFKENSSLSKEDALKMGNKVNISLSKRRK